MGGTVDGERGGSEEVSESRGVLERIWLVSFAFLLWSIVSPPTKEKPPRLVSCCHVVEEERILEG